MISVSYEKSVPIFGLLYRSREVRTEPENVNSGLQITLWMTKIYEHRVFVTLYSFISDASGMDIVCLRITMFPNYQGCFQGYVEDGKNWPIWGP